VVVGLVELTLRLMERLLLYILEQVAVDQEPHQRLVLVATVLQE
jgi:hypothetical protein